MFTRPMSANNETKLTQQANKKQTAVSSSAQCILILDSGQERIATGRYTLLYNNGYLVYGRPYVFTLFLSLSKIKPGSIFHQCTWSVNWHWHFNTQCWCGACAGVCRPLSAPPALTFGVEGTGAGSQVLGTSPRSCSAASEIWRIMKFQNIKLKIRWFKEMRQTYYQI